MDDPDGLLPENVREELSALDALLRSRQRESLSALLTRWSTYGDMLSRRQPVDFDDYQAMVFARDSIQDLMQRATLPVARVLEGLVSHHDSLFVPGTEEDDSERLGPARSGWWHGRVPMARGYGWDP